MRRGNASGRVLAERVLRGVALGALGLALWQRLTGAPVAPGGGVAVAGGGELPAALARWTAVPAPAVHARLDTLPGPAARAWLAALAAAGTRVTWRAARAPALAGAAEPVADPAGGTRLLAAAPRGAPVTVADALGALDSVAATPAIATPAIATPAIATPAIATPAIATPAVAPPATAAAFAGNVSDQASIILRLPDAEQLLTVRTPGASARLPAPAVAPRLGAVLVVGHAGWEGRFAAAALEERGWAVRTRFALAPGVVVGDAGRAAAPPRLDTAALAAVVAIDSSAAALAPAIARYVRAGGGLVLAGDAARAPGLAALAPAAPGAAVDDSAGAVFPLARPRPDAVPLARRRVGGAPVLVAAARRVGAGRVVQLGDAESWRRRMRPDEDAAAEHRAWWAQVVAAVAYAPTTPDITSPAMSADPAPLAATVAALGPAGDPPTADARGPRPSSPVRVPDAVLISLALAALLAEVASRRLRGAA